MDRKKGLNVRGRKPNAAAARSSVTTSLEGSPLRSRSWPSSRSCPSLFSSAAPRSPLPPLRPPGGARGGRMRCEEGGCAFTVTLCGRF
eukprot:3987362-Pyramimonas_sp.AAC.1